MPLSISPDDFVQGGLLQDVDVEVKAAVYEVYDYGGKVRMNNDPPIALKLTLQVPGTEDQHEEYITGGSSADFVPDPNTNGDTLEPNGTATALRKGCNLELFSTSLVAAGFNKPKLVEGKASNLVGQIGRAHV